MHSRETLYQIIQLVINELEYQEIYDLATFYVLQIAFSIASAQKVCNNAQAFHVRDFHAGLA